MKHINKYIERYTEGHVKLLSGFGKQYDCSLIIPCFNEDKTAIESIINNTQFNGHLLILVINQPAINHYQLTTNTKKLLTWVGQQFIVQWKNDGLALYENPQGMDILLVDTYSKDKCIDPKYGVGLARKIGNDIALKLIHSNNITSPWLFNSDADVALPDTYFAISRHFLSSAACYLYPYQHTQTGNKELDLAMSQYQNYLNHYVEGLKAVGSYYAWHSLGSILCINANHYAMVRGFPKRSAGEDFHILNKLTKVGKIQQLAKPVIEIETRLSDRVPFGTGPALNDILNNQPKRHFKAENFQLLQQWLECWGELWNTKALPELDSRIVEFINDNNIQALIGHSFKQSQSEKAFIRHMHVGFDALKTLQFLKYMNDIV